MSSSATSKYRRVSAAKGKVAAIIGGLGSFTGAVVGGLALGIAEVMLRGYLPDGTWDRLTDAVVFVLVAALFIVRFAWLASAISPTSMRQGTSISAVISGTGFAPGAVVTFVNGECGAAPVAAVTSIPSATAATLLITLLRVSRPRGCPRPESNWRPFA